MLIDFNETEKIEIPGMNNGAGTMSAKMHMDKEGKIIRCAIHKGARSAYTNIKTVTI